jgi:hypothetical protein
MGVHPERLNSRLPPSSELAPPEAALVPRPGRRKHDYLHTVVDAVNLAQHAAHPRALYVFNDVCDEKGCNAETLTRVGPALATCDLERSGFMRPLDVTMRNRPGVRGWAVFERRADSSSAAVYTPRPNETIARGRLSTLLPCVPRCRMTFNRSNTAARAVGVLFEGGGRQSPEATTGDMQRRLRPRGCPFS